LINVTIVTLLIILVADNFLLISTRFRLIWIIVLNRKKLLVVAAQIAVLLRLCYTPVASATEPMSVLLSFVRVTICTVNQTVLHSFGVCALNRPAGRLLLSHRVIDVRRAVARVLLNETS
jgi:hypothetical protein